MTESTGFSGLDHTWRQVLERLRGKLTPQQFETWFASLAVPKQEGETLCLAVPNRFYADWIRSNYETVLCSTVAEVTGKLPVLQIDVVPAVVFESEGPATNQEPSATANPLQVMLNPNNTFESFVVGPNNRLAHAAAMAVADSPGGAYNPLFLHGGCGLGKTHLLQAICHRLLAHNHQTRVLYVSCEGFLTEFVTSLEKNRVEEFRSRYREANALIVDDIHFLANKERTQEEFFHTFNALYARKGQVVLSSDSPPTEIPTLTDRLVSRFKWGLVARMDPPGFETRVAIVRRKIATRGLSVGDDVATLVAQRVSSNVRELEGAVIRLVGYASLSARPLDLTLAEEVLEDSPVQRPGLTIDAIQEALARTYKVKRADLIGKRRTRSIAYPRQIAMYLARKLTPLSLEDIGRGFGGRDHSTVLYACDKIEAERQTNPQLRDTLERLTTELRLPGEP